MISLKLNKLSSYPQWPYNCTFYIFWLCEFIECITNTKSKLNALQQVLFYLSNIIDIKTRYMSVIMQLNRIDIDQI